MSTGLVGAWSPGIGDDSVGGWLTVLLYLVAAWQVWQLLRRQHRIQPPVDREESWFWKILLLGLVALGINKQLDLQSAFTELGRIVADRQGWYAERRQVQAAFIAGIAILGLTLIAATAYLISGAPAATQWALVGSAGLVAFVIVRATSFHHVDELLGGRLSGLPINWVLEMGALLLIVLCTRRRRGKP